MPRKTRILHEQDEYLFVEAPGDPIGPALLVFARTENARAVPAGCTATHQTEHGLWVQVARFDGKLLELAPDPPDGLGERIKVMLPRYVEVRAQRIAQAKNPCFWIIVDGRALHGLHPAQPAGVLLKLWRSEEAAQQVLRESGQPGSVQSTGNLREFLDLRAEEGFAGALLDDEELIFFWLDAKSRIEFMKVSAADDDEKVATRLLSDAGRWEIYEGEDELEPFVDPEGWDRMLVRIYGVQPFLGWGPVWRCFVLQQEGTAGRVVDPESPGKQAMIALFHDPAAAVEFRSRHELPRATIERVTNLVELLAHAERDGCIVRLHPDDHRVRGGTLWLDRDRSVLLLGYAGIWRSLDGVGFTAVE